MTGLLAHIVRHPIKSVGWEPLPSADLCPDRVLPHDRHWAIAHKGAGFDGQPTRWHAKQNFLRGVAAAPLMAARAQLSEDRRRVALTHPDAPPIEVAPDTPEGAAALIDWVRPMWPETRPAPDRVVTAGEQALTDVPDPFVAVLSVTSNRALGQRMGQTLSIHRWRGNLWLDGFSPFEESHWIGRKIRIGNAVLRIEEPISRCNATTANPETGRVDADTLGALEAAFGHRDFGVYARVIGGGHIHVGDRVELL